jgi:predicted HAD superfamily phosphohydrolase
MKMMRVADLSWEIHEDGVERMHFLGRLFNEMRCQGGVASGFGATDGSENAGWVLMQYTGLKDRKDRDIYEGDIVKDVKMIKIRKELAIHEIIFCGGSFCMRCATDTIPFFAHDGNVLENMEIVGNVYENPELMR